MKLKEKENTTYQNLWEETNTMLREKFRLNKYIRKI